MQSVPFGAAAPERFNNVNSIFSWALFAHVVGIVFWVGGLLAACQVLTGSGRETSAEAQAALVRLARRLLKTLAHPGAAVAVLAGIVLLGANPGDLEQGWLHAKLAFVVILIAVDLLLTVSLQKMLSRGTEMSARRVKLAHGAIALLFLVVALLAVVKP